MWQWAGLLQSRQPLHHLPLLLALLAPLGALCSPLDVSRTLRPLLASSGEDVPSSGPVRLDDDPCGLDQAQDGDPAPVSCEEEGVRHHSRDVPGDSLSYIGKSGDMESCIGMDGMCCTWGPGRYGSWLPSQGRTSARATMGGR
jgi:hypothetical protein